MSSLTPFRDEDGLKNLGYVSDKAILLLGQAYAAQGEDDLSTQAYEQLLATFADSGWRRHARYGEARAIHKHKNYVEAIDAYLRAGTDAPPEVAVRSQIQVGICEIEIGQLSEAVESLLGAYDPDFPEMNAFALVEAASAQEHLGRKAEAAQLLLRCKEEYPKSPWSMVAAARLKKADAHAPHARPDAEQLLALGPQPVETLDPLGEQQPVETSVLDDLMDRACQAAILNRPPAVHPVPSPLLRLTLPEPFENRGAVRVRGLGDDLPPIAPLKTPQS